MADFLDGIINSVPVVGHVKGVMHYVVGDVGRGNKAMYEATRATAVLAGGAVGALAGPAGAIAGASGAGLVTDTVCSIATLEAHGVVEGLGDVASDLLHLKLPFRSVLKTGALAVSDMACGLGAGGISVGIKSVTKTSVEKVLVVSSKSLLIGGISSQGVLGSVPSCSPEVAFVRKYSSNRSSSFKRSNSNNSSQKNDPSNNNKANSSTKTNSDQSSSNASSGSGSERPNYNGTNKTDHSTPPDVDKPEIKLLRSLFNNVSLDEISLGKTSKQIFKNLTSRQIESLVSLLKHLQRNGRFEVIIRTIVYVCENIPPEEVTFENFLSISEFVDVYIEELFKNFLMWSSRVRIQKICFTPKQESDEKLYVQCCETIMKVIKTLREKISGLHFTKYFRDIYSAFYHYYKHRIIPITNREMGIDIYLALIESMMESVEQYQEYKDLLNPKHPRKSLIFERYFTNFTYFTNKFDISRRVRIVLRSYRGKVTLSSCYIRDKYFKDDRDGFECIIDDDDS